MKSIALNRGYTTLVSDLDYLRVKPFNWCVSIPDKIRPYAIRSVKLPDGKRTTQRLHHFILGVRGVEVDHINGNSLDNTRTNLRIVTSSQNSMNSRKTRKKCLSRFKGVTWHWILRRWKAQLKFNKTNFHLGYYENETEAARAYDAKARELFGEFACPNFTLPVSKLN